MRFAAARALMKVSGDCDRLAGPTLVALVADPEPMADRRAVLDLVLSAGVEVQDQAAPHWRGYLPTSTCQCTATWSIAWWHSGPGRRLRCQHSNVAERRRPRRRAIAGIAFATIGRNETRRAVLILLKMIDDLAIAPESRQAALEKIRELNETELVKATPILIRQLGSQKRGGATHGDWHAQSIIENMPALDAGPGSHEMTLHSIVSGK